jgi:hypothetical protein
MSPLLDRTYWFSGIVACGVILLIVAAVVASFKQNTVRSFLSTIQTPQNNNFQNFRPNTNGPQMMSNQHAAKW